MTYLNEGGKKCDCFSMPHTVLYIVHMPGLLHQLYYADKSIFQNPFLSTVPSKGYSNEERVQYFKEKIRSS